MTNTRRLISLLSELRTKTVASLQTCLSVSRLTLTMAVRVSATLSCRSAVPLLVLSMVWLPEFFFSPSHVGLCLDLKQDSDAHGIDQRLPSLAGLDSHQVRFVVWGILLLWIVFDSKFTNCNYHGTNTYLSMME